ncbi:hypothetical protein AB0C59_23730 [Streptomyces sp. NPDC048664]|uniref:hypothetical protein n=1 Tax=Streptomyces sp. NPDC048664 TaxID=3154505 RepID=UPI0034279AB5
MLVDGRHLGLGERPAHYVTARICAAHCKVLAANAPGQTKVHPGPDASTSYSISF